LREVLPVILSAAKDLASLPKRSKARAQDDRHSLHMSSKVPNLLIVAVLLRQER
jgi:hypothetical protein